MPKPLSKFLFAHLIIFLQFSFLLFIENSITEMLRRVAPGVLVATPLHTLIVAAFAIWVIYFGLRLFLGLRSGRLLVE